jgi:uncharacterized protein (DUF488 family)
MTIYTMGVYGRNEEEFFRKVLEHKIDTFCDIRRRRAVRGSEYTFVNSIKLQKKLKELGIAYFHFIDLSASLDLIKLQKEIDQKSKIQRRKRESLSQDFIDRFTQENLKNFDSKKFLENFDKKTKNILLFCVEKNPEACHRSLVAHKLAADLNLKVVHII